MAVEVKVPKDIKEYKEKVIAGMNLKQLLCLCVAAGVNILLSLVFIAWLKVPMEITSWLMILSSVPIVSFGWFKRNGLTFEVYIRHFFKYHFSAGVRKKQTIQTKVEETNKDIGGQGT
ncbi:MULTISPECIES: PrgI family protein [unclassified Enterococcus]|uniref:PrgI family protein n=1 Tax=unclassified Enterococcus TaxID=2608891 RepID=UPI0013EDF958|nr:MULTISPECIES: PrgI family protein [unclassified Enterococcus]